MRLIREFNATNQEEQLSRKKSTDLYAGVVAIAIAFCLTLWGACSPTKEEGKETSTIGQADTSASNGHKYRIGIVYFGPDPGADSCMKGLMDGLKELGVEEGKNLEVLKAHAQGEIANIPMLFQNYDNQGLDLIVPMSTPCLQAACATLKQTPAVFMYVYDPIAAGAGTSFTDHLPNITGVGSFPPIEDTIDVIQQLVPGVQSVGTIYNSSEANSRKVVEVGRGIFQNRGIQLEEVTVTGTSEIYQAAQVVASRGIQAFWGLGDNTVLQAFEGVVKVTTDARLPLVINDPEFTDRGALVAVGIGWYETGYATAKAAHRVLQGESPGAIPFENIAVKKVILNHEVAENLGISFPPSLIEASATQN